MIKEHMRKYIITNILNSEDIKQELIREKQIQWQEHVTPFDIVDQIIETTDMKNKRILVLFNIEIIEQLIYKYNVPAENIRFVADTIFEKDIVEHKNMYSVQAKVCTKDDWEEELLVRRATSMGFKHFDLTLTNPPFTSGIDLKIMQSISKITDEMVVVHPSTWLIDLKGKSKLFNGTKNMFGDRTKSVTLFNGNPVFGIGLFVPCSITHIDRNKNPEEPIDVSLFGNKFSVEDINDVTTFGPEWKTIVEPFMKKIKQYVQKNGNLQSNRVYELNSDKRHCQLAAIIGSHKDKDIHIIRGDDFYTFLMKDSDKNKGIRKVNLKASNGNTPMPTYSFDTETELDNFINYLKTHFARFCLALYKASQIIVRGELEIVPWLDFTQEWTDEKLFEYFGVDEQAQNYIREFLPDYYGLEEKSR